MCIHPISSLETLSGLASEISETVLTHEEAANLILWYANNNMAAMQVSNRVFWAVPGTGTAISLSLFPSLSSASTASSSSSSITILIAAAAAGACFIVILAILIVRRRRRVAAEAAGAKDPSSEDPNHRFSLTRSSSVLFVVVSIFCFVFFLP